MVSSTASAISFFALHLTQYPSGINLHWTIRFWRLCHSASNVGGATGHGQPVKRHFIRNVLQMSNIC
jgi:hypothetical protein